MKLARTWRAEPPRFNVTARPGDALCSYPAGASPSALLAVRKLDVADSRLTQSDRQISTVTERISGLCRSNSSSSISRADIVQECRPYLTTVETICHYHCAISRLRTISTEFNSFFRIKFNFLAYEISMDQWLSFGSMVLGACSLAVYNTCT